MAQIQTSVTRTPPVGRPGMVASGVPCKKRTYTNGTSTNIDFGVAIRRNTATSVHQARIGVGGAGASPFAVTEYLGITVEDRTREDEEKAYSGGADMTVAEEGDIWVTVREAVTVGDPVSAVHATGILGTTANATHALIPRASWKTAAAADGLALLSLGTDQVG